ncbi:MAG: glycosyltransferase, partial [Cyanobacteria bacterium SZAS LIN-2]|nr:glycosyltransferase [Cyanobacteria bacterium SZAS LIN-2]
ILRQLRCPSVTTMHNPVKDYCDEIYFACGDQPFVAISEAYKKLNYPDKINYIDTVYNGINIKNFTYDENVQRTNLLFVGRICRDKGTREAVEIARRVNLPLTIAGKIDGDGQAYFASEIEPHLDDANIKFIGEVTGAEKSALYTSAIATLSPINFEEPFGLVLAESIASGTPVLAFARGAVPEVISDGETGILGRTVDDLVGRFSELDRIDRSACRARAERLFSKERMAENYERVYERLRRQAADRQLHRTEALQEVRR